VTVTAEALTRPQQKQEEAQHRLRAAVEAVTGRRTVREFPTASLRRHYRSVAQVVVVAERVARWRAPSLPMAWDATQAVLHCDDHQLQQQQRQKQQLRRHHSLPPSAHCVPTGHVPAELRVYDLFSLLLRDILSVIPAAHCGPHPTPGAAMAEQQDDGECDNDPTLWLVPSSSSCTSAFSSATDSSSSLLSEECLYELFAGSSPCAALLLPQWQWSRRWQWVLPHSQLLSACLPDLLQSLPHTCAHSHSLTHSLCDLVCRQLGLQQCVQLVLLCVAGMAHCHLCVSSARPDTLVALSLALPRLTRPFHTAGVTHRLLRVGSEAALRQALFPPPPPSPSAIERVPVERDKPLLVFVETMYLSALRDGLQQQSPQPQPDRDSLIFDLDTHSLSVRLPVSCDLPITCLCLE
jgi:hypothetical protein